nr:hypothetical protein [Tanacetum cinerariifolium]
DEKGDDDDDKEGDDGDDGEEGNDDDDDDDDHEDEGDDDEDDQEEGSDDEQASDKEDEEFIHLRLSTHDEKETRDEESFDPIPKKPKNTEYEGKSEENIGTNVGRKEGHDEEDGEYEFYRDVSINQGRELISVISICDNPTLDAGIESIFETTSHMDVPTPTTVAPLPVSAPTITPSTIATVTTIQ